jgi:hypothetical protein
MTKFKPELEHEKYEELCALATAGVLTPAESALLAAHLEECAGCREAFEQYQKIATDGMTVLADRLAAHTRADEFDKESALSRLIRATERAESQPMLLAVQANKKRVWNRVWVRGLVAASLLAAVGTGTYWAGVHSANTQLRGVSAESQSALGRIIAEKQVLERTMQADNLRIAALEQQAITDNNDMTRLRAEAQAGAERLVGDTDAMNAAKKESDAKLAALMQERDENANKLRVAEKMYQTVQDELSTLRSQHQQDLVHLASLGTRVDSLSTSLDDQNRRARTDEQYLTSDKDIRDLIGARNLYIADIMDVNETGQSQKPFGRVFYTKTKSLIFYAYDLDRQPGVRRTSTFQVWGRTSANDRKPINLGILYMDSDSNRRWTLRVDNPEQLARLDAVFVTIEPREQTDKPTGKPFLYASLRREPNHP